jgi:hypothetical protein
MKVGKKQKAGGIEKQEEVKEETEKGKEIKNNSVVFGPQANYTDRASAACRRS